jgi:hypothetical protein
VGGIVNVTYSIPALFSETSSKNIGSMVTIQLQLKNYAGMDLSRLGRVKTAAAHRIVLLFDPEDEKAMQKLRRFLENTSDPANFVFHTNRSNPLLETNILNQGLYPALEALGLKQAGMHAFRRGCNRRWELAGIKPAVIRQQMGHSIICHDGPVHRRDSSRRRSYRFWKKWKTVRPLKSFRI